MSRRELTVVRGEERYPYSSGEVVEALQGAGVLTDAALSITSSLEGYLRNRKEREIELAELVARIERLVRERVSGDVAERFRNQTPPFVPLVISKPEGAEALSHRKLTRSLEKLGLSFKQANAAARQVEQTLRTQGYETVPGPVLGHTVALALDAGFGREVRVRYESTLSRPAELQIVGADGKGLPFSRGVLARSVMAVGLGPEMAYRLATELERELWRRGEQEITRPQMRQWLTKLLAEEAGEEYARRYDVLHRIRVSGESIIVMVGGAPGVGKSTIASELAYRLGISRLVSTDSVRQALRSLISPELSPVLHSSTFTAWMADLLPEERDMTPDGSQVVRGFMSQVRQLGPAIDGIVARNLEESSQLLIEGIHVVPGLTAQPASHPGALVIPLLLVVSDEQSHRDHFALRDRQTNSQRLQETYMKHFAEVRHIQDFLEERARAEGVRVIDASEFDEAVEQSLKHVLASMFAARGAGEG